MTIDFTKVSNEIIVDLINQSQTPETELTSSMLSFGTPGANVEGGNTALEVTATVAALPIVGTVTVTYNRVDIATVAGENSTEFEVDIEENVSDLLSAINTRFGINLDISDITDEALPTVGVEAIAVNVAVASECLVYTGTLAISIRQADQPLSEVINNTELDGLEF